MTCDTDGTYDFIPQCANLAKNFQQHPSWSAGWGGENKRDSLFHNLLLKTASHANYFYFVSATQQTPGPNGWIDNSTGSDLQHYKLQ